MTVDPQPEFVNLVGLERWERLQKHFSEVLGLTLRTLAPNHALVVEPSWPSGLDVHKVSELFRLGEELDDLLPKDAVLKQPTMTSRSTGIAFAAVPLRAATDKILAYLIVGPVVLGQREKIESFSQRLEGAGLDPAPVWSQLLTIKLYSYNSFKSVLSFLEEAGNTLLELAYQAQQLKDIVPEASRFDQLVVKHYSQRLCHSLLEVATTATKAQGGSVMLYEPDSRTYRIVAAQGLPDEVTRTTHLALGQGLAGLAAQMGEVLLLDDKTEDQELKARMNRPKLSSSIIAPLTTDAAKQPPLGVLNLRTTHPTDRFTQDHTDFIRKLMQLAHTAFASISLALPPKPSAN